jgi:hypothetical protein
MKKAESKTFDTRTEQGLKAAERYQAKLYNKYNTVTVTGPEWRTEILGRNPIGGAR